MQVPSWRLEVSPLCSIVRKGIDVCMLVRLTRTKRLKAGWLIAMAYLLCVLAPTISYALPGVHAKALCLTDQNHVPGMVHVHSEPQHVHEDGHIHDHAAAQGNTAGDDHSMSMASDSKSAPEKAPHLSGGQCCGLMCVTAIPATVVDIVKPSAPTALCKVEGYRNVADNAPPRLYRPPIS